MFSMLLLERILQVHLLGGTVRLVHFFKSYRMMGGLHTTWGRFRNTNL